MLKKTINFRDLDDQPLTEDFWFNLNKAEIAEMELSREGGLMAYLQSVIKDNDGSAILATFKDIIAKTVGQRSEDGKRFIKLPAYTEAFMETDAYSELFMELVTDANASVEFMRGIIPSGLAKELALKEKNEELSETELLEMTDDEFEKHIGSNSKNLSKRDLTIALQRRSRVA